MHDDESSNEGSVPEGDLLVAHWHVHADSNRISKGGETVKLEPRAMALLLYLAQRPGEVITREQLEAEVWRGRVVGSDALSNSITKLRKAFGDDRNDPRFIETVPKVGYRLIAEVTAASSETLSGPDLLRTNRKLAAILYADVAGYSRLTEADEEGTHAILSEYLDAIARAIEHHNGNVVHYAGDAVLADFATVVDALGCAVDIQRDLAMRNTSRAAGESLEFRMGINLGDVIVDRDDIYGEGVNVAARLESLAEPGGICISESVRGAIGRKLPLEYEFLGEQSVKNIAEAVRAYRVVLTPGARRRKKSVSRRAYVGTIALAGALIVIVALWYRPWDKSVTPATRPVADNPSIVVLPFVNLSDELAQEHVADGMTDDLITDLSRISGLFVIARHTAFTYKDRPVSTRQIAADLNVHYVLSGSIRKTSEQVRVNAQLIDASTDGQVWAQRYQVDPDAIFDLQRKLITSVIGELGVQPTREEQQRLARVPTTNLEAYDYYVRAERRRVNHSADFHEIMPLYQRALQLDPQFVDARAGLARLAIDIWQEDNPFAIPQAAARKLAYESASEVLTLDTGNADAYAVLARLQATQAEPELAEDSARKAVSLNANNAAVYLDLAVVLSLAGKHDEALSTMHTVFRLDPKPTFDVHGELGRILYFTGQLERAIEQLEMTRGRRTIYDTVLAASYVELDRLDEARAALQIPYQLRPFANLNYFRTLWSHYRQQDLNRLLQALGTAGMPDWPYGFEPASSVELDTGALLALTEGRVWTGHNFNGDPFVRQYTHDGRIAMRDATSILTGTYEIRDNLLCTQFPAAMLAREDCGHVYPHVNADDDDTYVLVTIGDVYTFTPSP